LKASRAARTDLFGIKRRYCEVCLEDCIGYEANTQMFPSSIETAGEFPTFCKHCQCPAFFHSVIEDDMEFPEDLARQLTSHNIESADLNFNCVLAAFLIKDEEKGTENVSEIGQLLMETGMEIISTTKRHITAEEAIYLRNQIVNSNERLISSKLHEVYIRSQKETDIRTKGGMNPFALNKFGEMSPYMLEKLTKMKEQHLMKIKNKYA
jgi:hypothetical protein